MPAYLSPGVYIEEKPAGSRPIEAAGTSVAAFVGFTEKRPADDNGMPRLITNWSQYVKDFGGFVPGAFMPMSIYGYFLNGGGICYVQSLMTVMEAAKKATNGNGKVEQTPPPALPKPVLQLPSKAEGVAPTLEAQSQSPGQVTITVADPPPGSADDQFRMIIKGPDGAEETFDNLSLGRGKGVQNAVDTVNKQSKLLKLKELDNPAPVTDRKPAIGTFTLSAPQPSMVPVPIDGAEPVVSVKTFEGDTTARMGIGGLEAVDEITMVCVPDLMSGYLSGALSREDVKAVQLAVMNHCELMKDRVAILDALPDMTPQQVNDWRMKEANYDSSFAALYYPWIYVANPLAGQNDQPSMIKMPPSGHIAGLYARVDTERGVHKAPANEVLRGAVRLETQITKGEQDILNPNGINCIRTFPGRGIRVWGARTLSSDASWRYVNVRRLFCMLEESIYEGTQWVVFEPNDYDLWARVNRDISSFLRRIYATGALFGANADQSFFVKCDEELNPEESRDAGQLFIEVGVAPVKPAEFVIIRFQQVSAGA